MSIIKANQWQSTNGTVYNIPVQTVYNNFSGQTYAISTSANLNWTPWNASTVTVTSKAQNSFWKTNASFWAASRANSAMSFDIWYQVNGGAWNTLAGQHGIGDAMEPSGSFGIACLWEGGGSADVWETITMSPCSQIIAAAGSTILFRIYFRNGGPGTDNSTTGNQLGHGISTAYLNVTEIKVT